MMKHSIVLLFWTALVLHLFHTASSAAFLPHQQSSPHQQQQTLTSFFPKTTTAARSISVPPLFLFGSGSDKKDSGKTNTLLDKKQDGYELARYTGLAVKDYDSLFEYIQLWAKEYFVGDESNKNKQKLLATPVKIVPTAESSSSSSSEQVVASKSIKIVFQKTDTGFQSKKDEKEQEQQDDDKKKKKAPKQGGVEIVVEKMKDGQGVCIRAVRCEMDEDTMIKEMSEETILQQLQKAIKVWKKDHASSSS